jgi:hypothetical protein
MPASFAFLFQCNLFLYSFILKFFILSFFYFSSLKITLIFALLFSLETSLFLFLSVAFSLVHFFLPAFSVFCLYFPFLFLPYFSFSREEAWCFSKHELVKQFASDIAVIPEHISCSSHLLSNWHAAIHTSEVCPSSTRFDA